MATIGHTLVGLSLGELCPRKARDSAIRYVWFGVIVLLAHGVDLIEWIALFFEAPHSDKHFLTHSPLIAVLTCVVVCVVAALLTRMKSPLPYLLMSAAVLSHLPLDSYQGRSWLASLYGYSTESRLPDVFEAGIAECWLYGLVFTEISLILVIGDLHATRSGRGAAAALGLLAMGSALTRNWVFWAPAFAVGLLHVALVLRRRLDRRMLWSLVPIAPLAVLPITQGLAGYYTNQANELRLAGDVRGALALNERVLNMPTRKSFVTNYIEMSRCYEALGDPDRAEEALKNAVRDSHQNGAFVSNYWLARFYMNPQWKGTSHYRPGEAEQILREILRLSANPDHQRWAGEALEQLHKRENR